MSRTQESVNPRINEESREIAPEARRGRLNWNRRLLITGLKIAISVVLIYWSLRDVALSQIFLSVRSANLWLLLAAFFLNLFGATFLRALRWHLILNAQGVNASIAFLVKSYMVSFFFSNFLPSTIGGDASRVYDSWRSGNKKVDALVSVFIDRFLGVVALMLLATSILPLSRGLADKVPYLLLWTLFGTAGILTITYLIFVSSRSRALTVKLAGSSLLRKINGPLDQLTAAFSTFEGERRLLARTLVISLGLQVVIISHYYLIGRALGIQLPFHIYFFIIPLAIIIMMIPISINAIGVRESTLVFLFSAYGIANSDALALSWLVFGIVVLTGLMGGLLYWFRKDESRNNQADDFPKKMYSA